jgi:hypothetical protein
MHDALLVRRFQRVGDLAHDAQSLLLGERPMG